MPAIAQGVNKQVAVKKQTGIGVYTPVTGSQIMRRESSTNQLKIATFDNNELTSHQQSTGKTHGLRSVDSNLNGVLSAGTYAAMMGSVLRKDFVAIAGGATGTSGTALAIALVSGTTYTLTAAASTFLTLGYKIGDIIRITSTTGGTGLTADCLNKNLLITGLTQTVITVKTLNGSTMTAGSGTTAFTIVVVGKKSWVPDSAQTKDYYMVEDWQADISQSELFKDVVFGKIDLGLQSTGNATIAFSGQGLDRATGAVRVLTTPTAETTANVLAAVTGTLIVNGIAVTNVTGLTISIDGKPANIGAIVGQATSPDIQRGSVDVTGSFTALYADATLSALFEAATQVNLVVVVADNTSANSEFVSFNMSAVTLDRRVSRILCK